MLGPSSAEFRPNLTFDSNLTIWAKLWPVLATLDQHLANSVDLVQSLTMLANIGRNRI